MSSGLEMTRPHFAGRSPIDAYGNGGFRFADMSHKGSLLLLSETIEAWPVVSHADITIESLAPVMREAGKVSLLLLGMGEALLPISPDIRTAFREQGIAIDVMDTGAAVRTYNILLAEQRPVAAAFIAVA